MKRTTLLPRDENIDPREPNRTALSRSKERRSHVGLRYKSQLLSAAPAGVEFVNEPVKVFTTRLRKKKGKDIWMMGGAGIIASFLDQGEIDEFMIHVIPKFIGEGIPLIAPGQRTAPLKLISCTKFTDGVVKLHYAVRKVIRASGRGSSRQTRRGKSESRRTLEVTFPRGRPSSKLRAA
jgi:riboflavin biosynthesis pyrimidine reductase